MGKRLWQTIKRAWDLYKNLRAGRDLLRALGIWKVLGLMLSAILSVSLTVWAWVNGLPGPLLVLVFLGAFLLVLMVSLVSVLVWKAARMPEMQAAMPAFAGVLTPKLIKGRVPHLDCSSIDSFGMYQAVEHACGAAIRVTNDESRYDSTAHNIRASIQFTHSLGDQFNINGIWYREPNILTDTVSLGMGERVWLLLIFWDATQSPCDFRAANTLPLVFAESPRLEYGQWDIDIALKADNTNCEHKTRVALSKTHPSLRPQCFTTS